MCEVTKKPIAVAWGLAIALTVVLYRLLVFVIQLGWTILNGNPTALDVLGPPLAVAVAVAIQRVIEPRTNNMNPRMRLLAFLVLLIVAVLPWQPSLKVAVTPVPYSDLPREMRLLAAPGHGFSRLRDGATLRFVWVKAEVSPGASGAEVLGTREKVLLSESAILTEKQIVGVRLESDDRGEPTIVVRVTDEGLRRMAEVGGNPTRRMAVVMNGQTVTVGPAPGALTRELGVTAAWTADQAMRVFRDLAESP